jgi:FkbM family methyltransferase
LLLYKDKKRLSSYRKEFMIEIIYNLYAYIFSKPWLIKFNKLLFNLSLRGLGVLNYKTNYQSGEIDWLKSYLSRIENPVVFDIGANVGGYSIHIIKFFPKAIIYAFEPHPKNFIKLKSVGGKNLRYFNKAVGSCREQILLYDYEENDGSTHASLYQDVIEAIHQKKSISYKVDAIKLDDFCSEQKIQSIDLLKIDTEGNELECLIGAKKLLKAGKIQAIQFEFNEMNIISRCTFKDFWEVLLDFKLYRLLPGGRLLEIKTYSPILCEIYAYQNIIALKRS